MTPARKPLTDTRASFIRLFWMGWPIAAIARVHGTTPGVVNRTLFARVK